MNDVEQRLANSVSGEGFFPFMETYERDPQLEKLHVTKTVKAKDHYQRDKENDDSAYSFMGILKSFRKLLFVPMATELKDKVYSPENSKETDTECSSGSSPEALRSSGSQEEIPCRHDCHECLPDSGHPPFKKATLPVSKKCPYLEAEKIPPLELKTFSLKLNSRPNSKPLTPLINKSGCETVGASLRRHKSESSRKMTAIIVDKPKDLSPQKKTWKGYERHQAEPIWKRRSHSPVQPIAVDCPRVSRRHRPKVYGHKVQMWRRGVKVHEANR